MDALVRFKPLPGGPARRERAAYTMIRTTCVCIVLQVAVLSCLLLCLQTPLSTYLLKESDQLIASVHFVRHSGGLRGDAIEVPIVFATSSSPGVSSRARLEATAATPSGTSAALSSPSVPGATERAPDPDAETPTEPVLAAAEKPAIDPPAPVKPSSSLVVSNSSDDHARNAACPAETGKLPASSTPRACARDGAHGYGDGSAGVPTGAERGTLAVGLGKWTDDPVQAGKLEVRADVAASRASPLEAEGAHEARTSQEADDRVAWLHECQNLGRDWWAVQGGRPGAVSTDRDVLRRHAFGLHREVAKLLKTHRAAGGDGPPVANWSFYAGPWVEDYWIATFSRPVRRRVSVDELLQLGPTLLRVFNASTGDELSEAGANDLVNVYRAGVLPSPGDVVVEEPYDFELFYPWVPLFVPWENLMAATVACRSDGGSPCGSQAREDAIQLILGLAWLLSTSIRDDVQYITVAQRPSGPALEYNKLAFRRALRNTLVLSAGGTGHIALPLLAQQNARLPDAQVPALGSHRFVLSFVGNERVGARASMLDALRAQPVVNCSAIVTHWTPTWREIMAQSALQLAPRGSGPTSFRLYEALQMGLVPVYVHDGRPWLPYQVHGRPWSWRREASWLEQSLWSRIGHLVHVDDFGRWVAEDLPRVAADAALYDAMRADIAAARERYFTFEGVMKQIYALLDRPSTSDLACRYLDPWP